MVKDKTTPEEKLLRIIEDLGKIKPGSFFKRFAPKTTGVKKPGKLINLEHIFTLASLTNALIGLAVILTTFLIAQVFFNSRNDPLRNWSRMGSTKKKQDQNIVTLLPLSDYLRELTGDKMLLGAPQEVAQAEEAAPEGNYTEVLANLKLVGIIWSSNPQAMIENSADGKTLLLYKGDKIERAVIKNIYQDRVILGIDNKEWELR